MAYIGSKPNDTRQLARREFSYAVTVASTTTFTGSDAGGKTLSYQPGELEVYMNGVRLDPADYTATTGSSVVLGSGANIGDNINIFAGQILPTDDYVSKTAGGVISSPITVNRNTTDGSIVSFNKDGTSVGSIGTLNGYTKVVSGNGTAGSGLGFYNYKIEPVNPNGNASDDEIDLGVASNRFKDAYLSGGIYLGGTAAANKLDDYEEGTWTPSSSYGTTTAAHANYVKVGRLVTLAANIYSFSDRTTNGAIAITGIPFASSSASRTAGGAMVRNTDNTAITASYLTGSGTAVEFYGVHSGAFDPLKHNDLNNSSSEVYFTISYYTDA